MKKLLLLITLGIGMMAFTVSDEPTYRILDYDNFGRGERLEFKVNFGIFSIGEAEMIIDDKFYKVNHRECYKIDIFGRTSGMVDWVANVNDHWGAYVDTAALVPHISYRNIREGKYKKDEVVRFDHKVNLIETKVVDKKTGNFKEPKVYVSQGEVRDMMAGALYLRTIDFSKMKKGEKFVINGFFEDAFYDLEMVYRGREKIKTKAGKFNAIRLAPVVPDNDLFDGDDSVIAWVTDDENRMPLKIQAKMFIGNVSVELSDFKNTKHLVTSKVK